MPTTTVEDAAVDPTGMTTTSAPDSTTTNAPTTTVVACMRYEVQAGDAPATIAASFGITVDELVAANIDTPGFTQFLVGTVLVIPLGC